MAEIEVTFIEDDGTVRKIENVQVGQSLMEVGRAKDVAGILADCGGACACATCHVYIHPEWTDLIGPANEVELDMLDMVSDAQDNSRLSCQIQLTDEMDGLKVTVAPMF